MTATPANQAASRLSTLSQQLRVTTLQQTTRAQSTDAQSLSSQAIDTAKVQMGAAKQVQMAQLLQAIDNCDLVAAETALQRVLHYAARLEGLTIAQAQLAVPA